MWFYIHRLHLCPCHTPESWCRQSLEITFVVAWDSSGKISAAPSPPWFTSAKVLFNWLLLSLLSPVYKKDSCWDGRGCRERNPVFEILFEHLISILRQIFFHRLIIKNFAAENFVDVFLHLKPLLIDFYTIAIFVNNFIIYCNIIQHTCQQIIENYLK